MAGEIRPVTAALFVISPRLATGPSVPRVFESPPREPLADRLILGCFLVLMGGFIGGVVGAVVGSATADGELLNEFATEAGALTGAVIGAAIPIAIGLIVWIARRVRPEE